MQWILNFHKKPFYIICIKISVAEWEEKRAARENAYYMDLLLAVGNGTRGVCMMK
jgi:hypothetical protein